jgi:trans-aconitate methyltransferase
MTTRLCELALAYRTDKVGYYTPFYSLLFEARRTEYRKVLEVGIGTEETMQHVPGYLPGASLFMWQDYFPNAEIWGVDIDKRALDAAPRMHLVHADSRDEHLRSLLPSGFDLIVDDGLHSPDAQWKTFVNLFPLVKDSGLYIIEDAEDWRALSELLEGYSHQIVLVPTGHGSGKLILIRK